MIVIISKTIEEKDLDKFSDKKILEVAKKVQKGLGFFLPKIFSNSKTEKIYFTSDIGAGRAVFVTKKFSNQKKDKIILLIMIPKNSKWGKNINTSDKKFMEELKKRAKIVKKELLLEKFRILDLNQ